MNNRYDTIREQELLTEQLVEASKLYYNGQPAAMSDFEFDKKVEELKELEGRTGIIMAGSPTVNVGAPVVTELEKDHHEQPALSLDKCKYANREKLVQWLSGKPGNISWKLDGLTIVATYDDGKLVKAVTRGDGEIGSVVTHNAKFFKGLPLEIPYKEHMVIRGEAAMTHTEFKRINDLCDGIYENERNLAAATIQMLDSRESRKREITFTAFEMVTPEPGDYGLTTYTERIGFMNRCGINTVYHVSVDGMNLLDTIEMFKGWLAENNEVVHDMPTDGLVLTYEDQVYGESLGATGHHKRSGIALKWTDETKTTRLKQIDWSVGKTGLVTPVAIFDPVRLGAGSTVTKASLHNISILRNVPMRGMPRSNEYLCLNDEIDVYLANMIIPQVASFGYGSYDNEHPRTAIEIPKLCPVCGSQLRQDENHGVWTLHCDNKDCSARRIGELQNTFGRDGLFVKGLGESQIKDLLQIGLIDKYPVSIFGMAAKYLFGREFPSYRYELFDELIKMDGWGIKSIENLVSSIEKARETDLQKFLYALNIPMMGHDLSKKLSRHWKDSIEEFLTKFYTVDLSLRDNLKKEITALDGVGEEKAENILAWWEKTRKNVKDDQKFKALVGALDFKRPEPQQEQSLTGKTFCITGKVKLYKNRDEFKKSVEARGGKVTGSVTLKTDALIINDLSSTTGKAQKARELGKPMITEVEFIEQYGK